MSYVSIKKYCVAFLIFASFSRAVCSGATEGSLNAYQRCMRSSFFYKGLTSADPALIAQVLPVIENNRWSSAEKLVEIDRILGLMRSQGRGVYMGMSEGDDSQQVKKLMSKAFFTAQNKCRKYQSVEVYEGREDAPEDRKAYWKDSLAAHVLKDNPVFKDLTDILMNSDYSYAEKVLAAEQVLIAAYPTAGFMANGCNTNQDLREYYLKVVKASFQNCLGNTYHD